VLYYKYLYKWYTFVSHQKLTWPMRLRVELYLCSKIIQKTGSCLETGQVPEQIGKRLQLLTTTAKE